MSSFALLFLMVAALGCQTVRAQQLKCDTVRPLENSKYGYRARGDRCEGLFVAEVAAPTVDLVSFTKGDIPRYTLKSGGTLHISVPADSAPISIRGLAAPAGTYYLMNTTLGPGKTFNWPVEDVLGPEHIDAASLGVVAWRRIGDQDVYFPIEVTGDGPRRDTSSNKFTIRPSFEANAVQWRYAKTCEEPSAWKSIEVPGSVLAGHPVDIRVDVPKSGNYCVHFGARLQASDAWVKPLRIWAELAGR